MSIPSQDQAQQQQNDKELNFRRQQEMYERKLEQERLARQQAEEELASLKSKPKPIEDDDDDEPYVDKKKLDRKLERFEEKMEKKIDQKAEQKAMALLDQERKNNYLRDNNDFNNVMSNENIQRFADSHPRLAENILRMPDGFERQKLVYENIKALGMDKPQKKEPSVQEKIDANRKSPYYQPSQMGTAPYANQSDYSKQGQKQAYDKMQELKNRLRL